MKQIIYADNAATTKLDEGALEAMKPFLLECYGNPSQPYSFSRTAKKVLKNAREKIAKCINADSDEVYFTSCGTESDNWAIKGAYDTYGEKNRIVASAIEHHAVINSVESLKKHGYGVEYINPDKYGVISPIELHNHIDHRVKLVTIMLANNEIGTIEPIQDLTELVHENGGLFHTDAVQAVGHIPVDVKQLGVDMLSASGHKFNGPKGVGFLYVKRGTKLSPYLDGGKQEFGKRAGTENVAFAVAMAAALEKNCNMIDKNTKLLTELEESFFKILNVSDIDYVRNGAANHLPGNINISIKGHNGETIMHRMDLMGICVSTGAACDTTSTKVSHVIRAIGVPDEYARGTIRISFGNNNNERDPIDVAKALIKICSN